MNVASTYIEKIRALTHHNFYITGAFLRDFLLNREITYIDLYLQENALSVAKSFAEQQKGELVILSKNHNTAKVVLKDEGKEISFSFLEGQEVMKVLAQQDFTIHAMALPVIEGGIFQLEALIDPFGGRKDLEQGKISLVSQEAFIENPLWMLRAVRLASQLHFHIDQKTKEKVIEASGHLIKADPKEISQEFFPILAGKQSHEYLRLLEELQLLHQIFPEIEPMKEVGQCRYHVVDVWTHSLYTLKVAESVIYAEDYFESHLRKAYEEHTSQVIANGHTRLQLIKLAALFHDIGKPSAKRVDETGRVRFRGHEITGMEIMANISDRLRLGEKEKQFLCKMVKEHMWALTLHKNNDVSGRALYDLFKIFGEDTLDVLLISLADMIATRKLLHPHEEMGIYKIHIEYLANNYLTRFRNMESLSYLLQEREIRERFEIEDKGKIEEILEEIRRVVFFGEIPPEKESVLRYIEEKLLI